VLDPDTTACRQLIQTTLTPRGNTARKLDRLSARILGRNGSITVRWYIALPARRSPVPNTGKEGTDLCHESNINRRGQIGDLRRLHKFEVAALERSFSVRNTAASKAIVRARKIVAMGKPRPNRSRMLAKIAIATAE
jgi:hypothetical protein